jgi:myo-inositol-1(or 4)-monophosphatase
MDADEQFALWNNGQGDLWCIDPLDGTSNFVRGLPYFAVSIALLRDGKSILGVVFDPVADEVFAAELGKGAFLNGNRLLGRNVDCPLNEALANVDLKRLDRNLASCLAANPPFCSQRNFGASALDWCYTAAGRFDAYLHGGQKLWDYAAGCLILSESGGLACSIGQDDFAQENVWNRSVIAAHNHTLFDEWKSWIRVAQTRGDGA